MIQGSFVQIEDSLPNGFHDASLFEVDVNWPKAMATFDGAADVSESDHERAVRAKQFRLVIHGLRSLHLPMSFRGDNDREVLHASFGDRGWCGGFEGWPPGQETGHALSPGAFVYSFFLHRLNDFISVEGTSASFEWVAEAGSR